MKIFIGLNNIASMFCDMKDGFEKLGLETLIISQYKPGVNIIQDCADYNTYSIKELVPVFRPNRIAYPLRNWWAKKVDRFFFKKALRECDVFLFISDSFLPDFSDLKEIKSRGKKIIFVFVGDDVRWFNSMKAEFSNYGLQPLEYPSNELKTLAALEKRLQRIRIVEKHADFIFSRLDQAQLQLRPYFRWNMMVNPGKISENCYQRINNPIVVHAPSSREVKGTKYLLWAVEKLKTEGYEFEFSLIENVPNIEAIRMYGEADILVDQLLCPGTGKLATEALATGTIVLSNMSYGIYPQNNPTDCPVIDVNPNTIYERLKWLIENPDYRVEHSKKGRPYVEKELDVKFFCDKVVQLLNGKNLPYDYHPSFLKDNYAPTSEDETGMLNKFNNVVNHEKWYKEYVLPAKRTELMF